MCSKLDVKGVMSQRTLMELRVCFYVFLYNETWRSQDVSIKKDDGAYLPFVLFSSFWNAATHTAYPLEEISGTNECTLQWERFAFYQLFNILSWLSVIAAALHHWLNLFHHGMTGKNVKKNMMEVSRGHFRPISTYIWKIIWIKISYCSLNNFPQHSKKFHSMNVSICYVISAVC